VLLIHCFTFAGSGPRTNGVKREVRCNTGAIPVAVSFIPPKAENVYTAATVPPKAGWEGSKQETSQKTCQVKY
jgi:hypothetical protein